jgi:tape measure domain-containing protein
VATDVETLLARIEVQTTKFERDMARARREAAKATDGIERDFERTNKKLLRQFEQIGGRGGQAVGVLTSGLGRMGLAAGVAATAIGGTALAAFSLAEAAQPFIRIQNALKVVGLEGEALKSTYADLFAIAQRQGTSIESTATLYSKLAAVQKELNASSPDLLRFTEGVGQALRVAGTDATKASGALLQLGQALGGGKIQAEEFNSIIDGARPILQTVANGLKEAGGSVSKLKQIVNEGKLSSEAFFRAFLAGSSQLASQAEKATATSSQAFERLKTSLININGVINDSTGASTALASGINSVSGAIDAVAKALPGAIKSLREYTSLEAQIRAGGDAKLGTKMGAGLGANGYSTGGGFGIEPPPGSEGRIGAGLSRLPNPILPVSVADFPVLDKAGKGGGGRTAKATDEVKRFADELNKSIDPTIEYNRQVDLLFQAMQRGLIPADQAAEAMARIGERTLEAGSNAAKSQAELEGLFKGLETAVQSVGSKFGDTLGDLVTGGKVGFADLSDSIIKDLVRIGAQILIITPLIQSMKTLLGAGGSSGGVAGLFSGLFSSGSGASGLVNALPFGGPRAKGGPVVPGKSYLVGERGPEMFTPTSVGTIVPNRAAMGGRTTVVVNQTFTADASARELAAIAGAIKAETVRAVGDAMARGRL